VLQQGAALCVQHITTVADSSAHHGTMYAVHAAELVKTTAAYMYAALSARAVGCLRHCVNYTNQLCTLAAVRYSSCARQFTILKCDCTVAAATPLVVAAVLQLLDCCCVGTSSVRSCVYTCQ
jgi:hypothetical protein